MSIFSFFKNKNNEESVIQKQIKAFEKLKIKNSYNAYSSMCNIIRILTLEQNIVSYIRLLKGAINELNINSISLSISMNKQLHEVTVSQFFLNDGKYIDTDLYIKEFNKLCVEFLTIYEQKQSIPNKDFNTQKNISLYSVLVNNVSSLCTELTNVFEENE